MQSHLQHCMTTVSAKSCALMDVVLQQMSSDKPGEHHPCWALFVDTLKAFFFPPCNHIKFLNSSASWKPKLNSFHSHYKHRPCIKMKKDPLKLKLVK